MRRTWLLGCDRATCVVVMYSLVLGCRTPVPIATTPIARSTAAADAKPQPSGRPQVPLDAADAGKLAIQFADASAARAGAPPTPLSASETQALLARLDPLPDLSKAPAPAMRAPSAAPARTGPASQAIAFVVPSGKTIGDAPIGKPKPVIPPLAAPQISPSGEVRAESEIRIRFDEPMVPIAAVGKPVQPPATITPAIAGTWRWIDTHVATFTAAAPRFPAASEYTVTVPAGLRALGGSTLGTAQTATFTTPPVMITGTFPKSLRPDSPIAITLDQDVDPAKLLPFLRVEANKKSLAFQPMSLDEARAWWSNNPSIVYDPKQLGAHYVILAPKTAWPAGVEGRIALAKNAPSKEGPRVTAAETDTSFAIAGPFTVSGLTCDDADKPRMTGLLCAAKGAVAVAFSNTINHRAYHTDDVQIVGGPAEDTVPYSETIGLSVPEAIGRTYTVAIADRITDVYGQALVGPRHPTFTTTLERFSPTVDGQGGLFVLDPRFEIPQWVVSTQAIASLHVELYQVQPTDYFAFLAFEAGKRATPPGKRIYDKQHAVGARFAANVRVDLRPALGAAGTGHIIAVASATPAGPRDPAHRLAAWIQVSKLGLTARLDHEKVSAWAQQITPANFLEPQVGLGATLLVDGRTDVPAPTLTDAQGHAAFELLPPRAPAKPGDPKRADKALLLVQSTTDSVFAAIQTSSSEQTVRQHHALWYATDDRFTYKPGELVYVKGWVRWTHDGVNPDLSVPANSDAVNYTLVDSRGTKLASGSATLTSQGGFDLAVKLPANANLGTARFTFESKKQTYSHPIAIEEFRTPTFTVDINDDVAFSGATPLVAGESIEMSAGAKYYSGGGLGGARIKWSGTLASASYRPPGWDGFSFAPVREGYERAYSHRRTGRGNQVNVRDLGALSGGSESSVVFAIAGVPNHEPAVLSVEAAVTDLDRATIRASSRPILVHPSAYYVGLRQKPKTTDTLELVVTDLEGVSVAGVAIDVTIEGVPGAKLGDDDVKVIDTQHCKGTSASLPVTCTWKRRDELTAYSAVARIADARGRTNAAQYDIPWWATADDPANPPDLAIVSDRREYRPGDIAKLDIRSAVVPATAVVSFTRQGMIVQRRIELATKSTTIDLPIEASYIQNLHVVVDRWAKRRSTSAKADPLPERVSAEAELHIDPEAARLAVTTRPLRSLVQPGEQATFEVTVRHDAKPVAGAEVALLVVDEAVLAVSGKAHGDPLEPFHFDVQNGTFGTSTLDLVRDAGSDLGGKPGFDRWSLDDPRFATGSGRGGMRGRTSSVPTVSIGMPMAAGANRKDFRATAVFSPRLTTDANGVARLSVKMPDSLTRYRVVALATANTRYFGKAESNIATQRKLNARIVAPRFLTQGDTFALPIIVQNLDSTPRTIDVAVRAANLTGGSPAGFAGGGTQALGGGSPAGSAGRGAQALGSTGPAGKRVTVAAGQRAELRFDFATKARGRVVIQTIASSNDFVDASTVELPVYEPATTESFASYGTVDDQTRFERLEVPADIFTDVGGVEAELASTQLQSLTDAFWYLQAYPFECAEQRSSRMLATAAMADILDAFATPGRPTRKDLEATRARDRKVIGETQNYDGGWGYFGNMKADPYVSVQVLTALAADKVRDARVIKSATDYVTKLANSTLERLERLAKTPLADRKPADRSELPYLVSLDAAALTSLAAIGVDVRTRVDRLHAAATTLASYPLDAKARLLALVAKQDRAKLMRQKLLAEILSAAHETASAATITASYVESERLLLPSDAKTTALALDALIREVPTSGLIPKLARGLLDARRRGRWMSTQENLAVLQAMRRYFDTYEKTTPSYTGKLWFGTAAYAEQAFAGRSTPTSVAHLDWSMLPPRSTHEVAIQKTGPGRMYYRIGITYAPKQTDLQPLDAGFIVRRSYQAVDDPADVIHLADGRWKIKLGAKVLVVLETVNSSRRYGVALVDPLPAGFEAVNTNLATSERAAAGDDDEAWDHTNKRDNRSEAFAMTLPEGSHRLAYTTRATTPGTFIAAPAKAEEMYSPETFGRSVGTTVVIE